MRISIKSNKEIEKMRIAGSLAAEVLEMISPFVVPGISTGELDKICYEHIVNNQNAIPANVGYKGYEKTICSSINQVICHGIPNNEKFLKEGDILNIDVITSRYQNIVSPLKKVSCSSIQERITTAYIWNDSCYIENNLLTVINISEPTGFIRIIHNYLSLKASIENNFG